MFVVHYLLAIIASLTTLVLASKHTAAHHRRSLTDQVITQFLDAHNQVRAAHGAVAVTWSYSLGAQAQMWTSSCAWRATGGSLLPDPYGENMVAATGTMSAADAIQAFASEKDEYDPANPDSKLSHFTQVVWKNTTEIGCGLSTCYDIFDDSESSTFVTCLYSPPGNVVGFALQNVQI